MEKMVLEDFRKHIYRCARVGWCKSPVFKDKGINEICPLYEHPSHRWESFSIRGILSMAQALLEGTITIDEKLVETVYQCNLCGGCHEVCVIHLPVLMGVSAQDDLDHIRIIEELRSKCVEEGFLKIAAHKKALESLSRYGNPFGISKKEERLKWIKGLEFEVKLMPKQRAKVLFYTGSMYALESLVQDTLKSIARVLFKAKVDFGILENELDDGLYAIQLGEKGLFELLAEENIQVFNKLGVETLVTPDPHSYNAFKRYYPRIGTINAEVLHITEYLERLINDGDINLKEHLNEIVTYHDPCNLGRICGIYDAPRNIIDTIKGLDFREMERSKNYSWCCGAGGGVMAAYPEIMAWVTEKRIEEVKSTGASTLITSCPWCEYSFKTYLELARLPIKVQNIVEIIGKAV